MANTRFQLEGSAAQLYELYNVPTMARPVTELMLEQVSLLEGDRILDVACGTGIVTRLVVQRFSNIGSILGVDINPDMLEVAQANAPTTDIPVEWRQGDICALPLPDDSFDIVLCNQGLQFALDKSAALGEIRRVLVSGGRLAFTVWSEIPPYHAALATALTHHVSDKAATSCLSGYTLRDAKIIRELLDETGFFMLSRCRNWPSQDVSRSP